MVFKGARQRREGLRAFSIAGGGLQRRRRSVGTLDRARAAPARRSMCVLYRRGWAATAEPNGGGGRWGGFIMRAEVSGQRLGARTRGEFSSVHGSAQHICRSQAGNFGHMRNNFQHALVKCA
jgi:hypothetical protein